MSALWGAVFMLIKYALEDFSPLEVAFFQAAIGAVGLLAIVLYEGGRARQMMGDILRRPLPAILLGVLAIAAPFILISLGELSVPSGLAGVLVSSTPMFVAIFAPRFDRSVEINRVQAAGLVVGLVGVALVVGLQAVSSVGQILGALAVLGAAASGALSSFIVKVQYRDKNVPPSTTTLFSLSVGAVIVAPFAAISASGHAPRVRAILAVIVLGLFCTALTFMLYYDLIAEVGEERGPGKLHNPHFRALLRRVLPRRDAHHRFRRRARPDHRGGGDNLAGRPQEARRGRGDGPPVPATPRSTPRTPRYDRPIDYLRGGK
jgi:drug/metabolite transporter (DMT)-like permease